MEQQALLGSAGHSVQVGFKLGGAGLQVRLEKQVSRGHIIPGLCGP